MPIRQYTEHDLSRLCAIHAAQGFDYALPDLSNPLFVTKLVLTRGSNEQYEDSGIQASATQAPSPNDEIVGAALLRLTAEAYLLFDPAAGTPQERWQWLRTLHAAAEREAWQRGLEDVHAWLPPRIATKFGKRIARLGWVRDDTWTPYCKRIQDRQE
jgi:hypothetical protein